jgi:hypothetical protein
MNLAQYWKPASAALLVVVLGVGAWLWFRAPASSGNNPPPLDLATLPPLPKDAPTPPENPRPPKDAPVITLPKDLPRPPKGPPAPPKEDSGVPFPPPPPLGPPKDVKLPM